MMKFTLVRLVLFVFFIPSIFAQNYPASGILADKYWALKDIDLSSLNKKQAAKIHKQMTRVLLRIEKSSKYEPYGKGSKFSLNNIIHGVSDLFIAQCIANEGPEMCLFGGWPSYRQGGSCKTPYGRVGAGASSDLGTQSYNSDVYCQDRGLFRCNPLVFGPGISPDLVPDDMGLVNGRGNNSEPYSAGICVDISGGFNGLSDRCAAASERLDQIREENDLPPWRESEFFNADRAAHLRALQELIVRRCQAEGERLNADGMCTALETNLALTAAAARAERLNGIAIEEIFPQCAPNEEEEESTGVSCEPSDNESLANLQAAIESLKGDRECQFSQVHVYNNTDHGDALSLPECSTSIVGTLAGGFPEEGEVPVTFLLKSTQNTPAPITVNLSGGMSSTQIVEALREAEGFSGACESSGMDSCNMPEPGADLNSSSPNQLAGLLYDLETVQGSMPPGPNGYEIHVPVNCNLTQISAVKGDGSVTGPQMQENQSQGDGSSVCTMGIDSDLMAAFSDPAYRNSPIPTVIQLRKGGTVFSVPFNLDSATVNRQEMLQQIRLADGFNEFCAGGSSETAEDIAERETAERERRENLRANLGMDPNQFLTPEHEEALLTLSDIEGLSVSVDDSGNVVFLHDNVANYQDRISEAFPNAALNNTDPPSMTARADNEVLTTYQTRGQGMEISDEEIAAMAAIRGRVVLEDIGRDPAGNITFTVASNYRGELGNNNVIRELERRAGGDYIVQPQVDETGAVYADRRMVLRPATGDRAPAEALVGDSGVVADPRAYRNLVAASESAESQIRAALRGDRALEENFNITIGELTPRDDGGTEVFINFFMDNPVTAQRNVYYGAMRRAAEGSGCRVVETGAQFDTTLQIICPPSN